jgi:hypothetical protein
MVLIVCLVLSHLSRLQWLVTLVYNYLTHPRAPQLIPYFDADGVFPCACISRILGDL